MCARGKVEAMAVARQLISPAEYLELERVSSIRHEYYGGTIYARFGGTQAYSLIASNVVGELRQRLRGGPCQSHGSDLRIKVEASGLYTYADAVVMCNAPRFEDHEKDVLLNPVLIAEVLSPSTEKYDRGLKFEHYRKIDALRCYLLISQDRPHVDLFNRADDGKWVLLEASGLESTLSLPAIGIELPFSEIYLCVEFDLNGEVLHENYQ